MSVAGKALVVAGGVAVTAGFIWWWLKEHPIVPKCEDYRTSHECTAAGCYWYNNKCHSTPEGYVPCSELGEPCYIEGVTQCDTFNNLCKCVGGKWVCIETESPDCVQGNEQHKCFVLEGRTICLPVPGHLPDECYGRGYGCSCAEAECDTLAFCEPRDNICIRKAFHHTISATTGDMYCFDFEGNSYCNYVLPEKLAAITLSGHLYYKWGPFLGEWADWGIFARYKGEWRTLIEGTDWVWGTTGRIPISASFEAQGIEVLQFGIGALFSNIHIDKFIGYLSY